MRIKKITQLFFVFCFLFLYKNKGQNLALNNSFESYNTCPPAIITAANYWINPNTSSPDYFNLCAPTMSAYSIPWNFAGSQMPNDSNSYAGIFCFDMNNLNTREYITDSLSFPLVGGQKYYVSFYASHADNFRYAVKTLGAYFTTSQPYQNNADYWQVTPQIENKTAVLTDTSIWYQVADTFTAVGGEQYITIGNFRPDSLSDTTLMYPGYYINGSYYFIDAVTVIPYDQVGVSELKTLEEDVSVFPNPSSGTIHFVFKSFRRKRAIQIFSSEAKLVKEVALPQNMQNFSLDLRDLESGLYFYCLQSEEGVSVYKRIILNKNW